MQNKNDKKWLEKFEVHREALIRLDEALKLGSNYDGSNINLEIIMDSCIKRFEFCYELFWKALKKLLIEEESIEANSPKQVFKEVYKLAWVSNEDSLLQMIESRNLTSHTYEQEMANIIYKKLPEFYELMKDLNKKLIDKYNN